MAVLRMTWITREASFSAPRYSNSLCNPLTIRSDKRAYNRQSSTNPNHEKPV